MLKSGARRNPAAELKLNMQARQRGCSAFVAKSRPELEHALIACFPVGIIRFEGHTLIKHQCQIGLVLELNRNAVLIGIGNQLEQLHCPAFKAVFELA